MSISLRIAQYNPQHLGKRTLYDVLEVFRTYKVHILSLTGTGQSQRRASVGGKLNMLQVQAHGYRVLQWPHRDARGASSNRCCGCMIALDKRLFPASCLQATWQPPDRLQGRGGAARLKIRGRFDICVICMYCPPPQSDPDGQVRDGLLRWLRGLLNILPARCTPVCMFDANLHVGLERVHNDWLLATGAGVVGPYGAERQSEGATGFIEALAAHDLALVNTHMRTGSGPTYFNTNAATRVDYVAMPRSLLERVEYCAVWRRTGHRLQLTDSARNIDHCPLVVQVDVRMWFTPSAAQASRLDLDGLQTAMLRGGPQASEFATAAVQYMGEWERQMEHALSETDVNAVWQGLNHAISKAAHDVFPAHPVVKGVVERELTVDLRRQHAEARAELWSKRGTEVEQTLVDK
eukprot:935319-Amphidinium_carterae.1